MGNLNGINGILWSDSSVPALNACEYSTPKTWSASVYSISNAQDPPFISWKSQTRVTDVVLAGLKGVELELWPHPRFKVAPSFITDVQSYNNRAVRVWFSDKTSETAVCAPDDTFSLETGITICIMKKLLGGTKEYNKVVRNALKTMNANVEAKAKAEAEKELEKQRRLKAEKRNAARREKRNRELAEAIARAQKEEKENEKASV